MCVCVCVCVCVGRESVTQFICSVLLTLSPLHLWLTERRQYTLIIDVRLVSQRCSSLCVCVCVCVCVCHLMCNQSCIVLLLLTVMRLVTSHTHTHTHTCARPRSNLNIFPLVCSAVKQISLIKQRRSRFTQKWFIFTGKTFVQPLHSHSERLLTRLIRSLIRALLYYSVFS